MESTKKLIVVKPNIVNATELQGVDSKKLLDVIMGMEENYNWFKHYNLHFQYSLDNEPLEFRNESQEDFASYNKQLQELFGQEYKNISKELIWSHIKDIKKPNYIKKRDIKSKEDFMKRFYFLRHEVLKYLIEEHDKLVKHTDATLKLSDEYHKKTLSLEEGEL